VEIEDIFGYYPQILDQETFDKAALALKSRTGKGGPVGNEVNIYQGILKCRCGATMVRVNPGVGKKVIFQCDRYRRALSDCKGHMLLADLDQEVLKYIDDLDVAKVVAETHKNQDEVNARIHLLNEIYQTNQERLTKLLDALQYAQAEIIVKKISELEKDQADIKNEIEKIGKSLEDTKNQLEQLKNTAKFMLVLMMDYSLLDADQKQKCRMQLKTYLKTVIQQIEIDLADNSIKVLLR
jgi:hypothetical protein